MGRSNKIFNCLSSRNLISEKELKYFTYRFKKATNLGKLYFFSNIHKRLSSVRGRPVVSRYTHRYTQREDIRIFRSYFETFHIRKLVVY